MLSNAGKQRIMRTGMLVLSDTSVTAELVDNILVENGGMGMDFVKTVGNCHGAVKSVPRFAGESGAAPGLAGAYDGTGATASGIGRNDRLARIWRDRSE